MKTIFAFARGTPQSKARTDDGVIDRLNHRYTTSMLLIFSFIVSTQQFVGSSINCWVPYYFEGTHQLYVEAYCWTKNTYYLPFDEYIPKPYEFGKRRMVTYYQWVPLILLVQALGFYIPCAIWHTFNNRSGMDLNNMIESGQKFQTLEQKIDRKETLKKMRIHMDRYLTSKREYPNKWTVSLKNRISRICCPVCGRKGNYLVTLYLTVKIFYIANVIVQLFALNVFLGNSFNFYGMDVLRDLANGLDWTKSQRFPRVTMCDFYIRRLGHVHRYTTQCVLPINLFNEKIYLIIWFWFFFVAIMTCISFLGWLLQIAMKSDQIRYIRKHLLLYKHITKSTAKDRVKDFVINYLCQDGVFIIRLLGHNTNIITATEFVCELWKFYKEKKRPPCPIEEDEESESVL